MSDLNPPRNEGAKLNARERSEHEGGSPLRVVVAAGGTAGHVVPALAVADELRERGAEVSFIGAEGRIEGELVPARDYRLETVRIGGLDRKNPLRAARSVLEVLPATLRSRRLLAAGKADVVLGGGGFVVGPIGAAALSLGIPLVLTEADRHLGLANRLLAKRAHSLCLAFPPEEGTLPDAVVTGRAVPRAVLAADRVAARSRFGVSPTARAVLVMGGSQGARSINLAAVEAFARDLGRDFHVIHVAGRRDYPEVRERLVEIEPHDYTLLEYEEHLGDCLAAADLVVARSGGSVFEILARGLPSVLIPYPHAAGDHQRANAEWIVEGGAAGAIGDADLGPDRLAHEVRSILDRPVRLAEMSASARAMARPRAAAEIADRVFAAGGRGEEAGAGS